MAAAGHLPLQRSAVFGSTRLAEKLLSVLDTVATPQLVLGPDEAALERKANGVDLRGFCGERDIEHLAAADWETVEARLREFEVETVLVFGDGGGFANTMGSALVLNGAKVSGSMGGGGFNECMLVIGAGTAITGNNPNDCIGSGSCTCCPGL